MYTSYSIYNVALFFYAKMHVLLVHATFINKIQVKKSAMPNSHMCSSFISR